ncbi:MAG: hypothetical protein EPO40_02905 [Myxococcaceae bacterium]|nr:MAG: hypothetical protein EPO40_02905 [Myxococcaceae bacterium]
MTTVTVELYAGPHDSITFPLDVRPGRAIPEELTGWPGYYLKTLRNDVVPNRHVYAWQHARSGVKRGCSRQDCTPTCPSRQAGRRRGTT